MCQSWGLCYFCYLFCMCLILQTPQGEYLLLHGVRTEMALILVKIIRIKHGKDNQESFVNKLTKHKFWNRTIINYF